MSNATCHVGAEGRADTGPVHTFYPRFRDIVGQTRAECRFSDGSCLIAYPGPLVFNLGRLSRGPGGIQIRCTCGDRNPEPFASSALYMYLHRSCCVALSFGGQVASKCEAPPTLKAAEYFPDVSWPRRSGTSILAHMTSLPRVQGPLESTWGAGLGPSVGETPGVAVTGRENLAQRA